MDRVEQTSPADAPTSEGLRVADVTPLDVTGLRYVTVMTAAWAVAFLVMLPFGDQLRDAGRGWWPWTCLVGFSLGLFGFEFSRRRARRLRAAYVAQMASDDSPGRTAG